MSSANIIPGIESGLQNNAIKVFQKMGISIVDAINIFLQEVVNNQKMPFNLHHPNKTTLDTMQKTDAGLELTQYDDVNIFYKELGI
jgi:addiction module RelB/DinJ family antitoxin